MQAFSTTIAESVLPLVAWAAVAIVLGRFLLARLERRANKRHAFSQQFPVSPMSFLDREVVIESLVNDPEVKDAMRAFGAQADLEPADVDVRVRRQAREIVPGFRSVYYFYLGYWMAKLLLLTLYRTRRVTPPNDAYQHIGRDATVVLFMNHRSNVDVLLVNYLLAGHSTVAHAAGEWARLWPLNHLVKLAGNYVVDRNANDPLYRVLLRRYVQLSVSQGIHLGIFPEGGLARDGLIQEMNFGLLNYVATARWPGMDRDVVFIPVSFNYDEVPEQERLLFGDTRQFRDRGKLYLALSSLGFCVRLLGHMLRPGHKAFGWACASFGDPVSLRRWQGARGLDLASLTSEQRRRHIERLGRQLMGTVASQIPVLPIHLLALALLDDDGASISQAALFERAEALRLAIESAGAPVFDTDQSWPEAYLSALDRLEKLAAVRTAGDTVWSPVQGRAAQLDYYANSVRHYLEPDALVQQGAIEQAVLDKQNDNYRSVVSQSYARVVAEGTDTEFDGFFANFYQRFVATSPEVASKFAATDMSAQQQHLKTSLEHMLEFVATGRPSERMRSIARSHNALNRNIEPRLYSFWLDSLLATLRSWDESYTPATEVAWRALLAPGIAYMTDGYEPAEPISSILPTANSPVRRSSSVLPAPDRAGTASLPSAISGIAAWIDYWAERTPSKLAVQCGDEQRTYRALAEESLTLAAGLQLQLSVECGDRVAILAQNRIEFITLLFACARLGAVLVPLNFRLAASEHRAMLAHAEVKALFIGQTCLEQMTTNDPAKGTAAYTTVLLDGDQANADALTFKGLLDNKLPLQYCSAGLSLPLLIVFTSGSTGTPKGAVLTQEAVHCNALHSALMHDMSRGDRIATTLPFFHVGGINIQTLPALRVGATVTIFSQFDPGQFMDFVASRRPTLTVLVPAQMRQLMDLPAWDGADMSSFKAVTTGSSVVDKGLIRAWANKGVPVIQVYGCTESSPIAAHQTVEGIGPGLGTVGHAALYTEIRIVDEGDADAAAGVEGEILLRGPNIMSHYWRDPEATLAALRDGWLRTGDLGYLDGNGRLCVVGRKKQLIISGGENIHPVEIERALEQYAGISQAAVVGVADPRWSEVPVAVVTLSSGNELDELSVRNHLSQCLGRYKHPHRIIVVDDLPHTALGKVAYAEVSTLVAATAQVTGPCGEGPVGSPL